MDKTAQEQDDGDQEVTVTLTRTEAEVTAFALDWLADTNCVTDVCQEGTRSIARKIQDQVER